MADTDITPCHATVRLTARLNIRDGAPSLAARIVERKFPGAQLDVVGYRTGERFRDSDIWYVDAQDRYFWSGAAQLLQGTPSAVAAAPGLALKRRADGTIRPLNVPELQAEFGHFRYQDLAGGAIRIDPDWARDNIIEFEHPLLARFRRTSVELHRKAARLLAQVFDQIEGQGLAERLLTSAGAFVPRHIGWAAERPLSSHSWGVAIDLNAEWNGYEKVPAGIGQRGSLLELVPLFAAAGFAWGGHFSTPDGMHFELARTGLT
jgi:D-alanyl-D-alanine carboxypeptidase